jgi:hypothetical protein
MRAGLAPGRRGTEAEIAALHTIVVDLDDPQSAARYERGHYPLGRSPTYVIRTSSIPHNRYQLVYRLDEPCSDLTEWRQAAQRLQYAWGADNCTSDPTHVWRVPGTINWPNAKKRAQGRVPEVAIVGASNVDQDFALSDFEDLPEPEAQAPGNVTILGTARLPNPSELPDPQLALEQLPQPLREEIARAPYAGEDRSKTVDHVLRWMFEEGASPQDAMVVLASHPQGAGQRYEERHDGAEALWEDVKRVHSKWQAGGGTPQRVRLTKEEQARFLEGLMKTATRQHRPAVVQRIADSVLTITPAPFDAQSFDPASIAPRPWVLGHRLQRGIVTALFAAGGTGKSTFQITTAMAVATGRELTGEAVYETGAVWIINNEDSRDEMDRRIAAACAQHGISFTSLDGRLFYNSGLDDQRFVVSTRTPDGNLVPHPNVQACIDHIRANGIKALFVDPLVSTHAAQENSNDEIERVAEQYRDIAHKAGCAIEIAHHTVKTHAGDPEIHAGQQDSGRGGGALVAAARSVWTLAGMSESTAAKWHLEPAERKRMVRLDNAKENQSISDGEARWFYLHTQQLPNGDDVGAMAPIDLNVMTEVRRVRAQAEADEAAEPERQDIARTILDTMFSDEVGVRDIVPVVSEKIGAKERSTRDRINGAIPVAPAYRAVRVEGGNWRLYRRRLRDHSTAPTVIVREWVSG